MTATWLFLWSRTKRQTSQLFALCTFYLYTYDISLLILVIPMAEKEMMIASKSLFKKRKKKLYHILKKKKIGDLQRCSRPATEIHFKCWNRAREASSSVFSAIGIQKGKWNQYWHLYFPNPSCYFDFFFFCLGSYTLPHISQL